MNTTKEIKSFFKENEILLSVAIIIILGFSVYINSIGGQFIWDDELLVRDNPYIKSPSNVVKIFTENVGAGVGISSNFYRPLQLFSYLINYSLFGLDVKGYHLTNIILHILVALSVYWMVTILYKDNLLSLLTGIFFVIHPIQTECVSYIAGRADLLAGLFVLLCFICYVKYLRSGGEGIYLVMLLSYVCALLSKENSLILPVLLLLYHYVFREKLRIKRFIPVIAITFCYYLLRCAVINFPAPTLSIMATLSERILGFFAAITSYIRLLLLPFNLHMEHRSRLFSFFSPVVMLGMAITFLSLFYVFKKRKKNSLIFFSILWFFVALLPQSNLYPINAYMAEHWLYIPSIGFFLIVSNALIGLSRRKEFRLFAAFFTMGLIVFYSCLTIKQNKYWMEPISFYQRTLKYAPDSARLYFRIANTYSDIGRKEKAIEAYKKAIEMYKKILEINPDSIEAYYCLGDAYRYIGKIDKAIFAFKTMIKLNPRAVGEHNNLGIAYGSIGRNEEAIASFKKAIAINPNYTKSYSNLGAVYRTMGRKDEAVALFKKAIKIDPDCVEAHAMLAVLYYDMGQYKLAVKHCDKTIALGFVDRDLLDALKSHRK